MKKSKTSRKFLVTALVAILVISTISMAIPVMAGNSGVRDYDVTEKRIPIEPSKRNFIEIASGAIIIDGDPSDWEGALPIVSDPANDTVFEFCDDDILDVYVTDDGTNLYFMVELGCIPAYTWLYLDIDVDQNISTGYNTNTDFEDGYLSSHDTGIDYTIKVDPYDGYADLYAVNETLGLRYIASCSVGLDSVVEVAVPLNELGSLPFNMEFLTYHDGPMDEAPDIGHITVTSDHPPVYNVSIISEPTEQTAAPNEDANYTLAITNNGNLEDTIELNITANEANYSSLSADNFSLNAGDTATAYLYVNNPDFGIYNTTVRATSQGNTSVLDEVTIKTTVSVGDAPTADYLEVEDACGESGTYVKVPVSIKNVKNGPVQSIRLTVDYDESVLNMTEISSGDLTPNWILQLCEDRHTVTIATLNNKDAIPNGSSGSVVLLNFHVIGSSGDSSPMDLSRVELSDPEGWKVGTAPVRNGIFYVRKIIFDTDRGTYPTISGTHNGTITPNQDIIVYRLYTYSCEGTGGHTEYVWIHGNGVNESALWNGYTGEYQYIDFNNQFILKEGEKYDYVIKTGSYPQIIHEHSKNVTGGEITCIKFIDASGEIYDDWIPAIRFE